MDTMVSQFKKVPRQTPEKEAGGGGVPTQAGRVQDRTAQRCPGEIGSVHGRWDLRVAPIRSASGSSVFILRVSFCCRVLVLVKRGTLRAGRDIGYGVFSPYTD